MIHVIQRQLHIARFSKLIDDDFVTYYAALLPRRGPHIASHSVCPSVCPSVYPSVPLADVVLLFYSRIVLRANIQNRKTSVFAYGPASRMYFSARTEGRISYGHLGRTNSCLELRSDFILHFSSFSPISVICVCYCALVISILYSCDDNVVFALCQPTLRTAFHLFVR